MKILRITGNILKWIIILLVLLLSLATYMGKSYWQTVILLLIAVSMAYWPLFFKERWGRRTAFVSRSAFILVMFGLNFTVFNSGPKKTIYTDPKYEAQLMRIYDEKVEHWPEETEDIFIDTRYGKVHVLACGAEENPPLLLLHAASMGAHSWAENVGSLLGRYRLYAVDNPGEGNKSRLDDAGVYPRNSREIADFYAEVMDTLGIDYAPVFGSSNGGYIAQSLAYYHPEKVTALALFGPMGLTQLTNGSIFMMSVSSMYPFQFIRDAVADWALGEDEYCHEKYGDWFNCIMKGTIPSVAAPVPMTDEQKHSMKMPVLLFLGMNDRIVGDADIAEQMAREYPDIRIEVLSSGHLVAVEHRDFVNRRVREFLNIE